MTGPGIGCGADCAETLPSGTSVTLTAAAAAGSTFGGWTGCDTPSGATCLLSLTSNRTVTATFVAAGASFLLTVQKQGSGDGSVTGSGISCGADCSETVADGASVTLTAAASAGSTFGGWTGCTSSSGPSCTVSMSSSKTVTASFTLAAVCTPSATRCTAGNIQVQERCNASGTAWVQEGCGAWRLCAQNTCRVACGMTTAPANPTACLVPIADGVNDGEWTYWTDTRMAQPTEVFARSTTSTGGHAPILSESGEAWPYAWSVSTVDSVGALFKLNQFGAGFRHPVLGFRTRRAGLTTANLNHLHTGVFADGNPIGTCLSDASFNWGPGSCTVTTPINQMLDYGNGSNSMLLSIAGDGSGGEVDLLVVNYVSLTITP